MHNSKLCAFDGTLLLDCKFSQHLSLQHSSQLHVWQGKVTEEQTRLMHLVMAPTSVFHIRTADLAWQHMLILHDNTC